MRRASLALACLLVLALVARLAWRSGDEAGEGLRPEGPVAERTPDVRSDELPAGAEPAPRDAGTATEGRAALDEEAPAPAPPDDGLAHLVGRFLLPEGLPAAGVALRLHGWPGNEGRVREFGLPERWENLTAVTDLDGRFDVPFDPPRAFQFTLDARLEGFAELSWRWSELPPGAVTDVGEQRFVRGGTIAGRVLRPDGAPAGGAWRVYAECGYRPSGGGADQTRLSAPADPTTGAFRFEDVPPGSVQLKAYLRSANWIDGPTLVVVEGGEHEADVVYAGADVGARITVVTFCRPFHVFDEPEDGAIVCVDAAGGEHVARKVAGSSQSWAADGLAPGEYTVRVDSPLHRPWSRAGVRPGQSVDALLQGSAAVLLDVVDGASGAALPSYTLELRFDGARFSPSVFTVREASAPAPAGGLYEGLIPATSTLVVKADGYAPCEVPLGELAPNETRRARAELSRGGRLAVEVRRGDGGPAAGAQVLLHPHRPGYDPQDPFSLGLSMGDREAFEAKVRKGETDADGRCALAGIPAGEYDLRASLGPVSAARESLTVDGGDERVVLELPATGAVVGRLLAPQGARLAGLTVLALPGPTPARPDGWRHENGAAALAEVDAEGRFRFDALAAGTCNLELHVAPIMVPTSFSSARGTQRGSLPLAELEVAPGAETRVELDLRDRCPGTLVVEASLDGAPAAGVVVRARCRVDGRYVHESGGQLDGDGRLAMWPVLVGDWEVELSALGAPWLHRVTPPVALASGGTRTVRADVRTASGRVRVLDAATGAPLARRRVQVDDRQTLTTDADGWLELVLTVDAHTLRDGGTGFPRKVMPEAPLDWTAGGPARDSVRLEVAPAEGD